MTWEVRRGDCIEVMRALPEASIDAIVCDPPYGLEFMGKEWDRLSGQPGYVERGRITDRPDAPAGGYAGAGGRGVNSYQAGRPMQVWHEAWAREALRVLKPGGHLLAFGGTRTYHRLTCAVEDAGFEVRDCLAWLYGSGFPKSLDVSKAIDKAAGAVREVIGYDDSKARPNKENYAKVTSAAGVEVAPGVKDNGATITAPATPDAKAWQGWGTALKPAFEPIVMGRKPLGGTVAANVLAHGTGALNVDGCRIASGADHREKCESVVGLDSNRNGATYGEWKGERESSWSPEGRWPANVLLDPEAAAMLDEQTGELHSHPGTLRNDAEAGMYGAARQAGTVLTEGDSGGASRFFYVAKASSAERNAGLDGFEKRAAGVHDDDAYVWPLNGDGTPRGKKVEPRANVHPTVKPIDVMRWLVRLVTPPGGTVLDPFTGSGTTGCAAALEGFAFLGIEREPEFSDIAEARIRWWSQFDVGTETDAALGAGRVREKVAETGQLGLLDGA